jgi:hypothetical protein
MITGRMSQSAINAAFARAAHLILDAEPKVLRDDYAVRFSGMQDELAVIAQRNENYARFARISEESTRAFASPTEPS